MMSSIFFKVKHLIFVDSTNNWVKRNSKYLNHTVVYADYQYKGRGQRTNKWFSGYKKNLLVTYFIKAAPIKSVLNFKSNFTDIVIQTLMALGVKPLFNEPNDIFVDGKKIAGILIETSMSGSNYTELVVGLGLNINQKKFPDHINATSLIIETRKKHSINAILFDLTSKLEFLLKSYEE
jgi:BirA family transcriptional regulator, biotin operon repressor / biotin---[acetyl-CoA-carboxylase] ligase